MHGLGDGQAIGVKTEGQVQDVWRLRDIIHQKESNTWEDEGFGDQMEKTVSSIWAGHI